MPLTDAKIRQAKASGKVQRLADGKGLYLEVSATGAKHWRYRYEIGGRENMFAIGGYPDVSLQEARDARREARELVRQGLHPSHVRQAKKAAQISENASTFQVVAEEWIEKKAGKRSPEYTQRIRKAMASNVYPFIGKRPLRSITTHDILMILERVVQRGAKTVAFDLRQWCSAVFSYGVITLRADYDPVTPLRGAIIKDEVTHAEALNVDQLQAIFRQLRDYPGRRLTILAVRLIMHTFVRTKELRYAAWADIDLDNAVWAIPSGKMKMGRVHVVPLTPQTVGIFRELKTISGQGVYVFPNVRNPQNVLGHSTINTVLSNLGVKATGHDFRATACTQLYEKGWDERYVEMQLAHVEKNQTRAAYNHAKYLAQRREMLLLWSNWLDTVEAEALKEEAPPIEGGLETTTV